MMHDDDDEDGALCMLTMTVKYKCPSLTAGVPFLEAERTLEVWAERSAGVQHRNVTALPTVPATPTLFSARNACIGWSQVWSQFGDGLQYMRHSRGMISLSLTSNTLRVTLSVPPIQTLLPWREEPLAFFAAREEEGVVIDYSLCSYLLVGGETHTP